MTGFEQQISGLEATALPTEPHNHCPIDEIVDLIDTWIFNHLQFNVNKQPENYGLIHSIIRTILNQFYNTCL